MGRKSSSVLLTCMFLMLALSVQGDVIYFKDGSVLIVEKAWEEGDRVNYQGPDGIQAIPRSGVNKIKAQQAMPAPCPPAPVSAQLGTQAATSPPAAIALPSGSRRTQEVSDELIGRLRSAVASDASDKAAVSRLVEALDIYSSMQMLKGEIQQARDLLLEAYKLDKRQRTTLLELGIVYYKAADYRAAEAILLEALSLQENDSYAHYLLGETYYAQDKIAPAVQAWETALSLGADPQLRARIKKGKEEAQAQSELGVLHSLHFILRYDRQVSNYNLGENILVSLEQLYRRLLLQLASQAPETVTVVLYTTQAYFDITQAPQWSGALFDGKIRIPAKGLMAVTPELESVLVHELAHCFLQAAGSQRCPTWFHEGVAQLMEGKSAEPYNKNLAALAAGQRLLPLGALAASWLGLRSEQAAIAYLEGLSMVEFLVDAYGARLWPSVTDYLRQNYTFQQAMETATGKSTEILESEWKAWLQKG
jgi:tetratricopeptide (TPR) repeat protein